MAGLREELQTVYEERGDLTPEILLEEAAPEDHPLHLRIYDKPEHEAARAHYYENARKLIRKAKITREKPDGTIVEARAFLAVRTDEGGQAYSFQPAEKVAADPIMREIVLRDMRREWKHLKERYEDVAEFLDMIASDLEEAQAAQTRG